MMAIGKGRRARIAAGYLAIHDAAEVVVSYLVGRLAELKPGAKIFHRSGEAQSDGTLQAPRINYR